MGFFFRGNQGLPAAAVKPLAKNAAWFVGYNLIFALGKHGIDGAAHIGGLLGGFACGIALALPSSQEGTRSKVRSNLLFLVAGLVLLAVLAFQMPKDRGLSGRFATASKIEIRSLKAFDEATAKLRAGTWNEAQLADAIEQTVIPGLRDFRSRLEALEEAEGVNTRMLQAMQRFTDARVESFVLMAHAVRTGNQEEAGLALKQQADAAKAYRQDAANSE